jgi:small-conductance mechanosensitive channel
VVRHQHPDAVAREVLAALEDDAVPINLYDAAEIESMPLAEVKERLAELRINSSLPNNLRKIISISAPSPAATLLGFMADDETQRLQRNVNECPLAEVTAELDQLGVNYRAGLAQTLTYAKEYGVDRKTQGQSWSVLDIEVGNTLFILLSISVSMIVGFYFAGGDLPSLAILSGVVIAAVTMACKDMLQNAISGMWLAWDGTIKKDDVIQFNKNQIGWVDRITFRYTVIKDWNDMNVLIPNTALMSGTLQNWTLGKRENSSGNIRLKIDVRVGFGTDVDNAVVRLAQAARRVKRVLRQLPPQAQLAGVGESAINLQLRFWINDPKNGITNVLSEVYLEVLDEFAREEPHKIIIPLPQSKVREIDDGNSPSTTAVKADSANVRRKKKG